MCFGSDPNRGQQLSLFSEEKCYTFVTVHPCYKRVKRLLHPGDIAVGTLGSSVACGTHREMLSMLLSLALSHTHASKMGHVSCCLLSSG